MKMLLLVMSVAGAANVALGQSVVNFNNIVFPIAEPPCGSTNGEPDRLVWKDYVGGTKLFGTWYKAELWYQDAAGNFAPVSGSIVPFRSTATSFPGAWNGAATGTLALPVGGVG